MTTTDDILQQARKYDRSSIERIFAVNYPSTCRLALALSGRTDVGSGVVRFVIKRALHALPNWKDEDAPQRWFLHHAILTSRRAAKHQPDKSNDTLLGDVRTAPPEYVAFIRALRLLPFQQREAFILHHGERLNERWSAVAMDCSVVAASNHLNAATAALQPLARTEFGTFAAELARVYGALAPPEALVLPRIRRTVGRHLWPRRIARALGWITILSFLAGVTWAAWKIWPLLEF